MKKKVEKNKKHINEEQKVTHTTRRKEHLVELLIYKIILKICSSMNESTLNWSSS